jgi:hypothetical protein
MNKVLKYSGLVFPFSFGIAVWLFFALAYSNHLHYQEQFQMFLFTSDYWSDLMSRPGGLADYLGTFFTQLYYHSWLGAFIIALLLVLLQQQVSFISSKLKNNPLLYPLTFIPSIIFWVLFCDENYLLTSLIAVMLTLLAVQLYFYFRHPWIKIIFAAAMLLALYWLVGGVFWIFALLCICVELFFFKQLTKFQWIVLIVLFVICIAVPPFLTKQFLQYPLSRLWWGISYNRYSTVSPIPLLLAWISIPLVSLMFLFPIKSMGAKKELFWLCVEIVMLVIVGSGFVRHSADWAKEEIMAYDYHVRMQNWDKVIAIADRKAPDSPLSVACLNLALCKEGKMNDNMFHYFQNGPEGLLPSFKRDFTVPMIVSEIYYHLGFLNTSMQYDFEAMEAIPDYKKSSRAIKRMAEVNLLNGEYKVAEKYLHMLQQTLFYRGWADEAMQCIGNETKIEANPEWAQLRKYRMKEDVLFSEEQKDQMLGLLFVNCKTNRMAYEYLIAYTLLNKDLNHFVQYFPLGKTLNYKEIPVHYQEALLAFWAGSGRKMSDFPWPVSQTVGERFNNYARLSSSGGYAEEQIKNLYSQTYWYYLQFRK